MLGRRKNAPPPPAASPDLLEKPGGKGRPTPKRREAEAERKARAKPPTSQRDAMRRSREEARARRARQREALLSGDERYLPPRDRGPVRRFVRDFVDSRRSIAEFFLPIAIVVLVGTLLPVGEQLQASIFLVWTLTLILIIVDSIVLGVRLRRALRRRFPDQDRFPGVMSYGLMRSTQMRRLRLPRPQVRPGDKV